MNSSLQIPVLIDFDGVLRIEGKPAPGAINFLTALYKEDIPFFIISNSTLNTGNDIKEFLRSSIEFEVNAMTTVDATLEYLRQSGKKAAVYCSPKMIKLFDDFIEDKNPDAVVIGDLGSKWTYKLLNGIFRQVLSGAEIIAMQKNKFWKPEGEDLSLDAGAFIKAIELVASKESYLIGKPSPVYFNTALKLLGFNEGSEFIMIGDDIETDIKGAKAIGGKGMLIYTGKTKFPLSRENLKPDFEVFNLYEAEKIILEFLKS